MVSGMTRIILLILALNFPLTQTTEGNIRVQHKWFLYDRAAADLDGYTQRITVDGDEDRFREPPMSFKGSDFWYEYGYKFQTLHPQHGARLAKGGGAEAGFVGCSKATYAKKAIRIDDLPVGSHVCVRTSDGRYAEMRIEGFDRKGKSFTFSYTTWKKDGSDAVAPRY